MYLQEHWLRRRSGARPLQGIKQASNMQKERKGVILDPTGNQSFLPQKTESRVREAVQRQERMAWNLRMVRSLVSLLFLSTPSVVFSKGRERKFDEGLVGENYNCIAAGGLRGLSPLSALQGLLLLRLRRRSGLPQPPPPPLSDSKQATNLKKEKE